MKNIAQFRFLGYKVTSSKIDILDSKSLNDELTINFTQSSSILEEDCIYKHNLLVDIFNEDKSIDISVKIVGKFEFDSDLEDSQKKIFFQKNAPALLFPYVRAYISTLTSLSGINSITLPTLNLSNMNSGE